MKYIKIDEINNNKDDLRKSWNEKKPFKWLLIDNFFHSKAAEDILQNFPVVDNKSWDNKTYINQKNKFQQNDFPSGSKFNNVFSELNDAKFLKIVEYITGISDLLPDEKLFGGGLHQSITGAFLDVHVDYNIHPETNQHRRLNIIIYMNKGWSDQFEGHLQLWDMNNKSELAVISPIFNRMVMFETNEVSYHGHPIPLKTPKGVTRKSLAVYYYSNKRVQSEITAKHNTKYINTQGVKGILKNLYSGIQASLERIF